MPEKENDKPDANTMSESHPPRDAATETSKNPGRSMRKSLRGDSNDASVPSADRRRFLVKMSLFGAASAAVYAKPEVAAAAGPASLSPATLAISGTGTVTSVCGTSTYSYSGSASYTIANEVVTIQSLQVTGTFVSGVDIGTTSFENVGNLTGPANTDDTYSASGTMAYTDDFNDALRMDYTMTGTTAGGVIDTISGTGEGQGLCTAAGGTDPVQTEILSLQ